MLKKPPKEKKFSSISIIIPAHNEGRYIKECIESCLRADFDGKKEIIVVDDGSIDDTKKIAESFGDRIKFISKKHTGKSDSINTALRLSSGEVIAVVDGDSYIRKDALPYVVDEIERKNVVAAACVVRVKNSKYIGMWLNIELLYNSLIRLVMTKIRANMDARLIDT